MAQQPGYNRLSESVRRRTPSGVLCATFCGGRKCRYDSPADTWADPKDMAVPGLYSHWVTDELLAMARPNADIIEKKNIVDKFIELGIRSVINLQVAGEHAYCGTMPLTPSGFTYEPEVFMKNNIYYYNFGWKDYGHGSLEGILDAVKVLSFALGQGKVAVHCHAGLGRTGVLLSCYLIYGKRWRAGDAIRHVRLKRPNSLQTSNQLDAVREFERHLLTFSSLQVFVRHGRKPSPKPSFTLAQHLEHQLGMTHGYESRALRHIPKIVYVVCERLLALGRLSDPTKYPTGPISFQLDESRPPFARHFYSARFDGYHRLPYLNGVVKTEHLNLTGTEQSIAMTATVSKDRVMASLLMPLSKLPETDNPTSWIDMTLLAREDHPEPLSATLCHWLDRLKQPVFTHEEMGHIVSLPDRPDVCFARFDKGTRYTLEYLLRFIQRLRPSTPHQLDLLLRRLAGLLTQQGVEIDGTFLPADRKHLGQDTLAQLMQFLIATLQHIRRHDDNPSAP